jgi:DNA-binding transcriptional regulator YhcF (GntR family)
MEINIDIDKEQLQQWYTTERMTTKQIGEKLKIAPTTTAKLLRSHGIEIRTSKSERLAFDIKKEWLEGEYKTKSIATIAKELKVCTKAIGNALKRHNIPRRTKEESYNYLSSNSKRKISKDFLLEQYKTKSVRMIAKDLKTSLVIVRRAMKDHGIAARTKEESYNYLSNNCNYKKEIDKDWLKKEYVDNKRTIADIADELSVNSGCVRRRLHKLNIEVRSQYAYGSQISYPHKKWLIPMLDELGIKHVTSHVLPKLPEQKFTPYEIDEWLPDHKVFLELNGYWHLQEYALKSDKRKVELLKKHYPDHEVIVIWCKE